MNSFRLYIYRLLTSLMPETCFFALKASLLRWCGAKVGSNVRIGSSAVFLGVGNLEIGDDVWIGAQDFISAASSSSVRIGSHCDLGPGVMVITGSHEIAAQGKHAAGKGTALSVEIGEGCWLAARSMVLPGVTLAPKTLLAAGAVVTKSVTGQALLMAGVPALPKRSLNVL